MRVKIQPPGFPFLNMPALFATQLVTPNQAISRAFRHHSSKKLPNCPIESANFF
jgi:hypothetical protein